ITSVAYYRLIFILLRLISLHLFIFLSPPSSFFNDTATTEIYTLSLHDALPICLTARSNSTVGTPSRLAFCESTASFRFVRETLRSEEHTSELQSRENLVCRLLLEKKKKKN